ncbi:unknown protein [Waddlia chondrophila 2032/99]|uniref:Uncharacterized protein n=1 Tax=Waddlia chondrophila 2032/99 TaxID=765953 RepID=F8LDU9_9BACT|nr:unknown protein [Waddlia chondrophila 2032/99]
MTNRLDFQFTGTLADSSDLREQFGEAFLGFARAAFGSHEISPSKIFGLKYQDTKIKACVATIFAFFLTLPISGLLTIAGAICLATSSTHAQKYQELIDNATSS